MVLDLYDASDKDVEHEVALLSLELSRLKAHLNSLRPISRLPSGILLDIFHIIVHACNLGLRWEHDPDAAGASNRYVYTFYRWLSITQVCHHWRDIAINTSDLWTDVLLHRVDALPTVLARSQAMPLSLFYCIPKSGTDESVQLPIVAALRPHLHRVRLLQVVSEDRSHNLCGPLFSCSLPSIQDIVLILKSPGEEVNAKNLGPLHAQPFGMWLKTEHVDLRSLSFSHVSFLGIKEGSRPSLRHLRIEKSLHDFPMSSLVSVLEHLPLLESLSLIEAVPRVLRTPGALPKPQKVVILPHLRSLRIFSPSPEVIHFLNHISYSNDTTIEIDLTDCDSLEPLGMPRPIYDLAAKFPQDLCCIALRNEGRVLRLSGWTKYEPSFHLESVTRTAPYTIRFRCDGRIHQDTFSARIFTTITWRLMSESLEFLHLDVDALHGDEECDLCEVVTSSGMAPHLHTGYISSIQHLKGSMDDGCGDLFLLLTYLWIDRLGENEVYELTEMLEEWLKKEGEVALEVLSVPQCSGVHELTKLVRRLQIRETDNVAQVSGRDFLALKGADSDSDSTESDLYIT